MPSLPIDPASCRVLASAILFLRSSPPRKRLLRLMLLDLHSDDTRPGGWTDLDASACCTVPSSLSGLTALPLIRAHIGRSSQQMTSAQSPVRLRPPLVSAALAPLLFRVVEDVVLSATKTDARTVMASLLSTAALVHLVRADLLRVKVSFFP